MNDTKQYSPFFKNGEYTAKRYFNHYKKIFQLEDYDLDDLVQEAKLVIFEVYEKYSKEKSEQELIKICNKAVGNRFNNILDSCKSQIKISEENTPLKECPYCFSSFDETQEEFLICFQCNTYFKVEESVVNSFPLPAVGDIPSPESANKKFHFEELRSVLTDQEYLIMIYAFVYSSSFADIGKKMGCSKQRAYQLYERALQKSKDYFA